MVDVGTKPMTSRTAIAEGSITMALETYKLIENVGHKKGDVLAVARLAGIMAAKRTSELIPLCHQINISKATVDFVMVEEQCKVACTSSVSTVGQTGVEMEVLMAVQVGLLTIYDMCKAMDRGMVISDIKLLEKSGGRSGLWTINEKKA